MTQLRMLPLATVFLLAGASSVFAQVPADLRAALEVAEREE